MRMHFPVAFTAIMLMTLCLAAPASDAQTQQSRIAPAEAPDTPSVTILGSRQALIVDVIVERSGRVRAAVIDFGGFLGVGSRKIAVDWSALRFAPDGKSRDVITLELTRDQVKEAPEYKDKQPVIVLGASGALQSLPTE